MKRFAILVLLGIAIFYWMRGPRSTDVPRVEIQEASKVSPLVSKPLNIEPAPSQLANKPKPQPKKLSPMPKSPPSPRQKEIQSSPVVGADGKLPRPKPEDYEDAARNGLTFFEEREGRAIAFGDVILGQLPKGANVKVGKTPLESPRAWPDGLIPYAIDPKLKNPRRVLRAIEYFNKNTPLQFVEFQGEEDAIVFQPGEEHCYSYLGRVGGHQPVYLSDGCGQTEILHELMHVLGFVHEHSRFDRDEFIAIEWDNIEPEYHGQFARVPSSLMEPYRGSRFDFESIMMYQPDAFAKQDGERTIRAHDGEPIRPQRGKLSAEDLNRIRLIYSGGI